MNKAFYYIALAIFFISLKATHSQAQADNKQYVISSAGQYDTTANKSYLIDWVIGEPLVETLEGSKKRLTQGFLQAKYTPSSYTFSPFDNDGYFTFFTYPNPFTERLYVNWGFSENRPLLFEFFDINGRRVHGQLQNASEQSVEIIVSDFPKGTYILRITDNTSKNYKTYTLIKN